MSECTEIGEKLLDWAEGELSGADQARVAAHLESCGACKDEARLLQALMRGIASLPELAAPSGIEAKVMARVRKSRPASSVPAGWMAWLQMASARPVYAGAMAIMLLVAGVAGYRGFVGRAPAQLAAVPSGVKLEIAAGNATLENGVSAAAGAEMLEGGLVEVSANFRGRLVYPDGTSVKLRSGSAVRVFSHSIALREGQVWLKVKKGGGGFQVETPQAVVAVRGTVFGVDHDPAAKQTQVQVEEGSVEVKTQSDSVMLAAGQGVKVAFDLKITRQETFIGVFDLNREDFIGKAQKNGLALPERPDHPATGP